MKKIFLSLAFSLSTALGFSQNLINNPSVEAGTIPTNYGQVSYATDWYNGCGTGYCGSCAPDYNISGSPDLFDSRSVSTCYDFNNKWGNLTALNGGNRYLGFSGGNFGANGTYYFGETVKGTINARLAANCPYTISFSAASIRAVYDCAGAIDHALSEPNALYNKLEVVLRKDNDCSIGKSVMISGSLNSTSWTQFSGQFSLTAAEAAVGYNRVEFRFMALPNSSVSDGSRLAFLDEVSLQRNCPPPSANYNFVTIGQTYTTLVTPYGPEELTQVCASPSPAITPVLINGGASSDEQGYGIEITPITVNATTYSLTGPSIYNSWISGTAQVPTTDININNLQGMTTHMQVGQTYLVTLFVEDGTYKKSRLFRINPLPSINAGADATICTADGVNVTTSNWPVQVSKGQITIGNYYSNPILLPAAANATYTFKATNSYGCGVLDNAVITMKACSRASFVFKNPITSETVNSPYGPGTLTHLCAPYKIDGSASVNEDGYHLRVQRFDIGSYQFIGSPLIDAWVGTGGQQAGNDINLSTLMSGFILGQTYFVALSVGPDWHSDTKFFKAIACAKNGNSDESVASIDESVALEELDVLVFPNPNNGVFAVSLGNTVAQQVAVTNILGETVFSTEVPDEVAAVNIDLTELPAGVYMVHVQQQNGTTILKKIVKN
jgi:hypothetical protein